MMPHELTALIAKVLFVLSATCVLMMARVRAEEIPPVVLVSTNALYYQSY